MRTAAAASLVCALALGTGTLGEFPAWTPRLVASVVEPPGILTPSVEDVAGTALPSFLTAGTATQTAVVTPSVPTIAASVPGERSAPFTSDLPDERAQTAIRTAMAQIGLPYVWGGDGPTNGDAGFDCSGLTTFSYAAAGVNLPRTAHTQYYAGPHVAQGGALQPGDLVFYGTSDRVHHVGMYLGEGKMVNAPTFGKPVRVAFYRWTGDDYLGATRPAANGTSTGVLPYVPPAVTAPAQPEEFPAPPAPAPTTEPQATVPQTADQAAVAPAATLPPSIPPSIPAMTTTVTASPTTPPSPTSTTTRAVAPPKPAVTSTPPRVTPVPTPSRPSPTSATTTPSRPSSTPTTPTTSSTAPTSRSAAPTTTSAATTTTTAPGA